MKLEEMRDEALHGVPLKINAMLQVIHIAILARNHINCGSVRDCASIYKELKRAIERFEK